MQPTKVGKRDSKAAPTGGKAAGGNLFRIGQFSARRRAGEAYALLLVTHFLVDCFSSALPTVQPILVERFSLTLAHAGVLGGVWMLSSSFAQLPFGLISDRLQTRYFTVVSPAVTAVFLSAIGLAPGFATVVVLLLAGGFGSAAYHPHSTSQAGRLGAERKGFATAVFITCGTAGLGLGPLYLTAIIEWFGFDRLWISAIPVVALLPALWWRVPRPIRRPGRLTTVVDWSALRKQGRGLLSLYSLVVLRSIVQVGLAQFLTLYMVQVRGADIPTASAALAVYFLSNSIGSFVGGAAADRFGGRAVIIFSKVACVPLFAGFVALDGLVSIAALFLGGVILLTTIPVNVVMAQELVPSQAGTTSAMMMGFGWGTAGILFVPLAGWLADIVGLQAVFWTFAFLPLLCLPIALSLPRKRGGSRTEPQ